MKKNPEPKTLPNTFFQTTCQQTVDLLPFLELLNDDEPKCWAQEIDELLWIMVDRQRLSGAPYNPEFFAEFYYKIRCLRDAFAQSASSPSTSQPTQP